MEIDSKENKPNIRTRNGSIQNRCVILWAFVLMCCWCPNLSVEALSNQQVYNVNDVDKLITVVLPIGGEQNIFPHTNNVNNLSNNNNSNLNKLIIKPTFSSEKCDNDVVPLPIVDRNNLEINVSYSDFSFGDHLVAYLCISSTENENDLKHLGLTSEFSLPR